MRMIHYVCLVLIIIGLIAFLPACGGGGSSSTPDDGGGGGGGDDGGANNSDDSGEESSNDETAQPTLKELSYDVTVLSNKAVAKVLFEAFDQTMSEVNLNEGVIAKAITPLPFSDLCMPHMLFQNEEVLLDVSCEDYAAEGSLLKIEGYVIFNNMSFEKHIFEGRVEIFSFLGTQVGIDEWHFNLRLERRSPLPPLSIISQDGNNEYLVTYAEIDPSSTFTIDGSTINAAMIAGKITFATDGCVKHECTWYGGGWFSDNGTPEWSCDEHKDYLCWDGQDNDDDGYIDCDDPDCGGLCLDGGRSKEECYDGLDNNCNGLTDCDDPDCRC